MDIGALFYLRDTIICLGVLVGLAVSIFIFTRRKTSASLLSLSGYLLLSVEPFLDIIVWRILGNRRLPDLRTLNIVYACVSGPVLFLGMVLLAVGLFLAVRSPPKAEQQAPGPAALP